MNEQDLEKRKRFNVDERHIPHGALYIRGVLSVINRISKSAIAVYTMLVNTGRTIRMCLHELRTDQRGVSGIVVECLLVLVAVMLAVVLYNVLRPFIKELFEKITTGALS